MKTEIDFTIDKQDLQVLFLHTQDAYKGYTFERWEKEVKEAYSNYFHKRENPKTFFEWVNGLNHANTNRTAPTSFSLCSFKTRRAEKEVHQRTVSIPFNSRCKNGRWEMLNGL